MTKKPFVTKEQIEEIAKTYPTPFHIYDEKGIRENARRLKQAFSVINMERRWILFCNFLNLFLRNKGFFRHNTSLHLLGSISGETSAMDEYSYRFLQKLSPIKMILDSGDFVNIPLAFMNNFF